MDCAPRWQRRGTIWYRIGVVMPLVPSPMEDPMCWEIDYKFFAEQQKKAQEARIKQEQRAGVIDRLLTEANEQREKTEETPVKEVAPAK
jgi:tRNA(His) 5'-end guanylyltransferase